jgi:small subunit ribosomal protein S18
MFNKKPSTFSSGPSSSGPSRPPMGGPGGGRFRKHFVRRKVCRFCMDKVEYIDFKNVNLLRNFITERGKMLGSRTTGVCASHQRALTEAIKRARSIALLPFTVV